MSILKRDPEPGRQIDPETMPELLDFLYEIDTVSFYVPIIPTELEPTGGWLVGVEGVGPLKMSHEQAAFFVLGSMATNAANTSTMSRLFGELHEVAPPDANVA